jgi:mycoredoxin
MKKIVVLVFALVLFHNWDTITDYFVPREDGSYANDARVIVYSTSWCGACKKAKRWLSENGVSFTEIDVERSNEGRRRFEALGGRGVPLIVIRGKVLKGFNPIEMQRLIN